VTSLTLVADPQSYFWIRRAWCTRLRVRMRGQQIARLAGGHRSREQEALCKVAVECTHRLELFCRLDPFGDGEQPKRLSQAHDVRGDCGSLRVVFGHLDEPLVVQFLQRCSGSFAGGPIVTIAVSVTSTPNVLAGSPVSSSTSRTSTSNPPADSCLPETLTQVTNASPKRPSRR
jgi:hypothetical protein